MVVGAAVLLLAAGTHLTCFTGTKVQVLTLEIRFDSNLSACAAVPAGVHFTCFSGTKSTLKKYINVVQKVHKRTRAGEE